MATSLQQPLSSVPKVAVVERGSTVGASKLLNYVYR